MLYIAHMNDDTRHPVLPSFDRSLPAHERRFLLWSLFAALIIIGFALIGKQFALRSPARIVCAVIEGAVSGAIIVGCIRQIGRLDEMQRRIHLEALALAFAGTGILATTYGFLVSAGLPDIDWGTVLWPSMVLLWVVGLALAGRRYR